MFRYKAIGQSSTITLAPRSGKPMDKTAYEKREEEQAFHGQKRTYTCGKCWKRKLATSA